MVKGNERKTEMATAIARAMKDRSASHMKLRSDERLRRELDQRQCEWEPRMDVQISDVDLSDNEYQTRLDVATADRELIEKYKERIQAGDTFPEVLLAADRRYRTGGKPRYKIVCGKHRLLSMRDLGVESFNALVIWVSDDSDKSKARDISIHDNVANGKPVSNDVMNEQIARECILESGGFFNGCPDPRITRAVCERHRITKTESVKKHIDRLLFQHECRAKKLVPPSAIDVCATAYYFVDKDGFADILRAVCKHGECKGLPSVLRDCRRRRQCGAAVVKAVVDHAAGYTQSTTTSPGMSSVDKTRLLCDGLVKHLESSVSSDASVTIRDCKTLDDCIALVCERGSMVVSVLRKKATGA
jgi:hypothetical protein